MSPSPILQPRPYQREAIDAVRAAHARGVRRPALVLPTGAGKTVVFGHFVAEETQHGKRSLIVAHRNELIRQAVAKVRAIAPHLRVGVVKAREDQVKADVVVASEQTLRNRRRRERIRDVGLVVVDEAHHATSPSYRAILGHFGCFDDDGPYALGVTATMSRSDGAALGEIWQDVVYRRGIAEMIRDGYLCGVRGVRVQVVDLDLAGLKRSGGDYGDGDLGRALEASLAPDAVAKAYREHVEGEQGILFAPTKRTAGLFADALEIEGLTTAVVVDSTPQRERDEILDDFRAGRIQVLCNCGVFTEGTDLPMASVAVIARPTLSGALYVQMCGRVLRPYPGKARATILDVTGASARHSLVGHVDLFGEHDEKTEREDDEDTADELVALLDESGETEPELPSWATGKLTATEVDLFHGSELSWLATARGVWFLRSGERYIALVPGGKPGSWDVVAMHQTTVGQSRWVIQGVEDIGYAMAYAEGDITPYERVLARKGASWEYRPASASQRASASQWGVGIPRGASYAEAEMILVVAHASARIDSRLP